MATLAGDLREVYVFLTDIAGRPAVPTYVMPSKATPPPHGDATQVPLPAERAFVVQLRAQADSGGDLFVGRAEHIASGVAVRFGSVAELLAFITNVLRSSGSVLGEPSDWKREGGESG